MGLKIYKRGSDTLYTGVEVEPNTGNFVYFYKGNGDKEFDIGDIEDVQYGVGVYRTGIWYNAPNIEAFEKYLEKTEEGKEYLKLVKTYRKDTGKELRGYRVQFVPDSALRYVLAVRVVTYPRTLEVEMNYYRENHYGKEFNIADYTKGLSDVLRERLLLGIIEDREGAVIDVGSERYTKEIEELSTQESLGLVAVKGRGIRELSKGVTGLTITRLEDCGTRVYLNPVTKKKTVLGEEFVYEIGKEDFDKYNIQAPVLKLINEKDIDKLTTEFREDGLVIRLYSGDTIESETVGELEEHILNILLRKYKNKWSDHNIACEG